MRPLGRRNFLALLTGGAAAAALPVVNLPARAGVLCAYCGRINSNDGRNGCYSCGAPLPEADPAVGVAGPLAPNLFCLGKMPTAVVATGVSPVGFSHAWIARPEDWTINGGTLIYRDGEYLRFEAREGCSFDTLSLVGEGWRWPCRSWYTRYLSAGDTINITLRFDVGDKTIEALA